MRRALTQAETPSRIVSSGDPTVAAALERALRVSGGARDYTHGFHTYPARMHPLTARRVLQGVPPGARVLDPFSGSGTVLVEGILRGAATVGVDASPLAQLIARAKTGRPPPDLATRARSVAAAVLAQGKAARRSGFAPPPRREASAELEGWFDPHVRAELEALLLAVANDDLLRAVLSSILVKMSRRASDTRGEKVARKLGRGMAARLFASRAEELQQGLRALWKAAPPGTPPPELHLGDARALPLPDGSVHTVLTSPPYAGTYDYLDQQRLRMVFLGLPVEPLAKREIGGRRHAAAAGAVDAYARDVGRALAEIARVLRPGGRAYLLVGDSLAGDKAVHADDVVRRASALTVVATASAERAPWGAAERAAFRRAPKREHLICLEKPSPRG